ncbi:hypothetical protein AB0D45_06900 [Streptomyces sp. NPDC048352]|uniref:hypothetical protein n=1 Tax=Streptomyces sp. NPDC048352 TaxID=3154718 RepID=UPI0034493B25
MRSKTDDARDPLVAHLREIEATERDRWVAADEAYTKAEHGVSELRQRLLDAEQQCVALEHDRTVASERLAAVREAIASVEQFLTQPGGATAGIGRENPEPETDEGALRNSDPTAPKVRMLILESLAGGEATPLQSITAHVQGARPGTPANSVRSTLVGMREQDRVVSVGRGIYQLLPPEAHT